MTIPLNSKSTSAPKPTNQINQGIDQTQGQVIAQMMGGVAVGQLKVYLSQTITETKETTQLSLELGKNPYQGLKAFREMDGERFFGRETQIQELWQRFNLLHADRATTRILPIYGPSGSGKSSLARAGLIPALGKQPLPGQDQGRVVVLTPGDHPLEALATVLARIATNDPTPVAKTREFSNELLEQNTNQEFDGLRRIASVLPEINFAPLIFLVDQFEELYTLCDNEKIRCAFIENLLCAARDSTQRVSVILTMRSDFLGATQQHPRLNQLFSSQGFLVPIMQPEELAMAITEPAKQGGYELDKAIIQLLIEECKDQDGALPLLQFALTQIWEGLRQGVKPADTLEKIGGVGGALACEAKGIYNSLKPEQQNITRSLFLALLQINDNRKTTRRRVTISELVTSETCEASVREVIDRFARPGVWILVTSASEKQVKMVEVAHETLIHNWQNLQEWLKEHGEALRQKRKIERAATEWQNKQKSQGYLLQGRMLRDAKEFLKAQKENTETALSSLAVEFVKAGIRKQINSRLKLASIFLIFPLIGTLIFVHFFIIDKANSVIYRDDCQADSGIKGFLEYMWWTRYANRLRDLKLCNEDLGGIDLPRSLIEYSDFRRANLSNADFRGSIMTGSDFEGATLILADFRCIDNACSALIGSNFQNVNLEEAKLQGSFLNDVNFKGANLKEANLEGAKYLTLEQLKQATLCRTILPSNLNKLDSKGESLGNRDCTTD